MSDDQQRADVYQDHPRPDAPQEELARIDSAVDTLLISISLVQKSDLI